MAMLHAYSIPQGMQKGMSQEIHGLLQNFRLRRLKSLQSRVAILAATCPNLKSLILGYAAGPAAKKTQRWCRGGVQS